MSEPTTGSQIQGTVKWFDNQKGFGFIVGDDLPDIFVHYSAIEMSGFRTLRQGDPVQFELVESPKGLQARNVARVDSESPDSEPDSEASSAAT